MSSPSSFSDLTLADFIKGISDGLLQDNVLLKGMNDNGAVIKNQGGNGFEFRVRVTRADIGGAVTDYDTGNAATINPNKVCVGKYRPYLWRLYENALQQERNEYAPEASKIADNAMEDLNVIKQEASERIGRHLYADGATRYTGDRASAIPIEGLDSIILASGTYFGLSRTTYTALNSQLVTCVNPSLTDNPDLGNNLQVALESLYVAMSGGENSSKPGSISPTIATAKEEPNMFIFTSSLFQTFRLSLNTQNQYIDKNQNPRKSLAYGNAECIWDTWVTASRVYGLNWKYIRLKVVGPDMIRLMKTIDVMNPIGQVKVIGGQMQLFSTNPRYLGKITTTGN